MQRQTIEAITESGLPESIHSIPLSPAIDGYLPDDPCVDFIQSTSLDHLGNKMSHNENYRGYELECALSFDGAKQPAGQWIGVVRYRRNGARLFNAMSLAVSAANARTARLRVRALARDNIDKLADRTLRNIEKNGMQGEPACRKKPPGRIVVIEQSNGFYRVNITFGYRTILEADCDLSLIAFFRTARAAEIEGIVWAKELMSENARPLSARHGAALEPA